MVDDGPGRRGARTRRQWRGHRQGGPGNARGVYCGGGGAGGVEWRRRQAEPKDVFLAIVDLLRNRTRIVKSHGRQAQDPLVSWGWGGPGKPAGAREAWARRSASRASCRCRGPRRVLCTHINVMYLSRSAWYPQCARAEAPAQPPSPIWSPLRARKHACRALGGPQYSPLRGRWEHTDRDPGTACARPQEMHSTACGKASPAACPSPALSNNFSGRPAVPLARGAPFDLLCPQWLVLEVSGHTRP